MTRKDAELSTLQIFKNCYNAFPEGEIQEGESPDFIVMNMDYRTGIELCEIFQDSHLKKGSQLKRRQSTQDKFENCLISAIQPYTARTFSIGVDFNRFHDIRVKNISELIEQCVPACLEFILNNTEGHTRLDHHPNLHHPLPDEIDSISIFMLKPNIPSFNSLSQGGPVSNLELKHIEPTLIQHNKALLKYRPCDEYWLVIREGNYYAGKFSEVQLEIPIHSEYHKVFLLRTNPNQVIELK